MDRRTPNNEVEMSIHLLFLGCDSFGIRVSDFEKLSGQILDSLGIPKLAFSEMIKDFLCFGRDESRILFLLVSRPDDDIPQGGGSDGCTSSQGNTSA